MFVMMKEMHMKNEKIIIIFAMKRMKNKCIQKTHVERNHSGDGSFPK